MIIIMMANVYGSPVVRVIPILLNNLPLAYFLISNSNFQISIMILKCKKNFAIVS